MKKIIFMICWGFPFLLAAQRDFRPGYIVNLQGDSVKGFVQYMVSKKIRAQCNFRVGKKGDTRAYGPDDISGFGYFGDKVFISKSLSIDSVKPERIFIEKLVEGKVNLYRSGKFFWIEKDKVYFLKNSIQEVVDENVLYQQQKKEYIGVLNMLFFDCIKLADQVNRASLNEKDLVSLTATYNQCEGDNVIVHKLNKAFLEKEYYLFGGVTTSNLSFSSDVYPHISKKISTLRDMSPAFGAGLQISHPRSVENISGTVEFLVSSQNFADSYSLDEQFHTLKEDVSLKYLRTKIPIGLKFSFSSHSFSPYLRFGYCYNIFSKGNLEVSQEKQQKNTDVKNEFHSKSEITGFRIGQMWAAAGVQKNFGRLKGFAEFRIEGLGGRSASGVQLKNTAITVIDAKTLEMTSFNALIGIRFSH